MSERYIRLFSLPQNLYSAGAPVIIEAGALHKDSLTGKVIAQLKLRNIQNKVIKAATVRLSLMDTAGKPIGEADFNYLDLSASREADFAQKIPVPLEDANTRAFSVKVKDVVYADNSTWTDNGAAWEPLTSARTLEDSLDDKELVNQFRIEYGQTCKYEITHDRDLWRCSCGRLNHESETACTSCGLTPESVDLEALTIRKDERLVLEQQEAKIQSKKNKIFGAIVTVATIVVIAIALISGRITENKNTYEEAVAAMQSGNFSLAAENFEKLGNYMDSAEKLALIEPYLPYIGSFVNSAKSTRVFHSEFRMKDTGEIVWAPKESNLETKLSTKAYGTANIHRWLTEEISLSDNMEAVEKYTFGSAEITATYTFEDEKIHRQELFVQGDKSNYVEIADYVKR